MPCARKQSNYHQKQQSRDNSYLYCTGSCGFCEILTHRPAISQKIFKTSSYSFLWKVSCSQLDFLQSLFLPVGSSCRSLLFIFVLALIFTECLITWIRWIWEHRWYEGAVVDWFVHNSILLRLLHDDVLLSFF